MRHIAALLTVHNRCVQTISCLKNLYAQDISDLIQLDVFLVDDGCTDGTAEAVGERFPQVYIIQGDGSLYWNRGMHLAWKVAAAAREYDYYLWLNDDTDLFPDAINSLLRLSAKHADKAIVVGATQNKQGDKLTYGGHIDNQISSCDGCNRETDWFNGNIVLIPQIVYRKLGNLDYYYRHSKGDVDYGIRAKKAGIKMIQCGTVLGVCEAHATMDGWCNPDIPFRKRWKMMHLPNGMPPNEIFHLEKQTNIPKAMFHYVTVYLRCMFPQLWLKRVRR